MPGKIVIKRDKGQRSKLFSSTSNLKYTNTNSKYTIRWSSLNFCQTLVPVLHSSNKRARERAREGERKKEKKERIGGTGRGLYSTSTRITENADYFNDFNEVVYLRDRVFVHNLSRSDEIRCSLFTACVDCHRLEINVSWIRTREIK